MTVRLDQLYGGQAKLLTSASWQVYRIDPNRAVDRRVEMIHGHELLDGPIQVPEEARRAMAIILTDESSYYWEHKPIVKLCTFEPCIVLRFEELEVMVSFACDRVKIFHRGKLLGMKDIDPGHNRLLEQIKPLFPDDTYIQLLQEFE